MLYFFCFPDNIELIAEGQKDIRRGRILFERAHADQRQLKLFSADVARRIEELKTREREAFELFKDGAITQAALSIEIERNAVHRHLLMCLALVAGEHGEVPDLVVVQANSREIARVFPSGKLPADSLQPNKIYECEPGGKRRVRYLTLYQWSEGGAKFAVFAGEENAR